MASFAYPRLTGEPEGHFQPGQATKSQIIAGFQACFPPWCLEFSNTFVMVLDRPYFYMGLMAGSFQDPSSRKISPYPQGEKHCQDPRIIRSRTCTIYLQLLGTSIFSTPLAVDLCLSLKVTDGLIHLLAQEFPWSWQLMSSLNYSFNYCLPSTHRYGAE